MNDLNLENRYDQVALAGAAMGHRLPENPCDPTASWWGIFTAHLTVAIDLLHRPIKDVFLFDHLDCGAYKELHPDSRIRKQYAEATLLKMRELHAARTDGTSLASPQFLRRTVSIKQRRKLEAHPRFVFHNGPLRSSFAARWLISSNNRISNSGTSSERLRGSLFPTAIE